MNLSKQKNFYKISFFLIIFFPAFLLAGRVTTEIGVFLIIVLFLYDIFRKKNYVFFKNFYFYYFLVFYLYLLIRTFFYSLEFEDYKTILFYLRFGFFFLAFNYFLIKININKKLLFIIIFFFIFLILDSMLQFYFKSNTIGIELYNQRATSFFGQSLRLGSFLLRFFPFVLIIILFSEIDLKKNKLCLSIFFSFYFHTVFLTGERTSLILLFLMLSFVFLLLNRFRMILIIALFFFIGITSVSNYFSEIKPLESMWNRTVSQAIVKNEKSDVYLVKIFSKDHHGHYLIAWRMFLDNPLFGQGVNSFKKLCKIDKFIKNDGICSTHPHNTYLQLLAEAGLIGFLFVFFIFILILRYFFVKIYFNWKNKVNLTKYESIKYISLLAIFINFWPFSPNGNFFNNWLSAMYYYPVGFYLYSRNK